MNRVSSPGCYLSHWQIKKLKLIRQPHWKAPLTVYLTGLALNG